MNKGFTTAITVDQSPAEVYAAILDARGWWQGQITGPTDRLHESFRYEVPGVHLSVQQLTESVPAQKIVWRVTESNLAFVTRGDEWTGTALRFDIVPVGDQTQVVFTHEGLVPAFECYGGCSGAWEALIGKSLRSFIATGKGVKVFPE